MMNSRPKTHRIFRGLAALILIAGLFPAISSANTTAPQQQTVENSQPAINVVTASEPELTVAPGSCLITSGDSVRIDYLLNANCGDIAMETLPAWPRLSVIKATSTEVTATSLPAPPTVRWGNTGISLAVPNLAILPSSLYINLFAGLAASILINTSVLLTSRLQQSKTLAELQVQRC